MMSLLHKNGLLTVTKPLQMSSGLSSSIMSKIAGAITNLRHFLLNVGQFLYDTFLAAGEDNNAKLIANFSP